MILSYYNCYNKIRGISNEDVTLNELRDFGVLDKYSGPRPFTFITQEQFETIYKLGMEE